MKFPHSFQYIVWKVSIFCFVTQRCVPWWFYRCARGQRLHGSWNQRTVHNVDTLWWRPRRNGNIDYVRRLTQITRVSFSSIQCLENRCPQLDIESQANSWTNMNIVALNIPDNWKCKICFWIIYCLCIELNLYYYSFKCFQETYGNFDVEESNLDGTSSS